MSKPIPYLTIAETLVKLYCFKENEGTGTVPFVHQGNDRSSYSLCKLTLARAGANNVYKPVSRGGQPVMLATCVLKPEPLLTVDDAIRELERVRTLHGPDVPFLASGHGEFQLCDIWPSLAGVSNVLKTASRGGQRVANVALFAPDK